MQNCRRASLKVRFHTSGRVRGVAFLDDAVGKICAVCENFDTISVFNAMPPYEQLRGIHVNGLRGPTDIVACTMKRLLYVSDQLEGCVWQVTTGGKVDLRFPTWSPTRRKASSVNPVSLSVRRGRLVVVEVGRVSVYDPHDNKADEIKFPDSVTLHHAVENDRRAILVALSDSNADMSCSSVIREMQQDVIGKWCAVREWNLQNSDPLYMALDTLGFLHVAIRNSRKVLVLDNTLSEVRSIRLHRRSMPKRLCFLALRYKLYLIVESGAGVSVYDGVIPPVLYPKIQRNVTL